MESEFRLLAEAALGFMPAREGLALYEAALPAARLGPLLEIGSYCGKSAIYLGAAAQATGTVLFLIDHHRGSEEHQPGEEYHDVGLVDADGRVDTLDAFRRNVAKAGLEECVIAIVGRSDTVAAWWQTPLGFALIDGGHTKQAADLDYTGWAPWVKTGGILAVHDVFEDPDKGGRSPYDIYRRALASGAFKEIKAVDSLRVLKRIADGT